MTDRFVAVPDSLELPTAVKVPSARISDSTESGRALLTGADAAAQRESLGLGTAAVTDADEYATAAQGAKADATTMRAFRAMLGVEQEQFYTAPMMALSAGASTYGIIGPDLIRTGIPAWTMPGAAINGPAFVVQPPDHWVAMDVHAVWCNTTTGTGAVRWRCDYHEQRNGIVIPSSDTQMHRTVTALGRWKIETTPLGTITINPSSAFYRLEPMRYGEHADDTLAGDIALIGVSVCQSTIPTTWSKL